MSDGIMSDYLDRILFDLMFYIQGKPADTEWFLAGQIGTRLLGHLARSPASA